MLQQSDRVASEFMGVERGTPITPLLAVSGLTHSYGSKPVLTLLEWHLLEHQHQLLLGPSGSGKTTLLSIISGNLMPTQGCVQMLGTDLYDIPAPKRDAWRTQHCSFVFQDHFLISSLSVWDNLSIARLLARQPKDDAWLMHVLDSLAILHLKDQKPDTLSRGEAQRAAIARAVGLRPRILLADEPTSALDDENAAKVCDLLLKSAQSSGATLVIATHDSRLKPSFNHSLHLAEPQGATL